jgi:hypothetical protein
MILDEFEVKPGDFKEGGGDFKQVDTDKLEWLEDPPPDPAGDFSLGSFLDVATVK